MGVQALLVFVDGLVEYLLEVLCLNIERNNCSDLDSLIIEGKFDGVVDEAGDGGFGWI